MIGAAPFYFGAAMAFLALLLFFFWKPSPTSVQT
jgi:hypothetical protein